MSRLDYCQYELVDDCYDWKNDHCDGCNIFKAYCEGARRAKNLIVHCKDCKWYMLTDHYETEVCTNKQWDISMAVYPIISENDFCSYGERREP